eukprot:SAG22_NODE_16923_length_314_cov_1.441860_1_plen_33_part_01
MLIASSTSTTAWIRVAPELLLLLPGDKTAEEPS